MPHRRREALNSIQDGVKLLLKVIEEQQDRIGILEREVHSYEVHHKEDREKIAKLRQTIRAQQAGLQNEQPKD